MQGISIPFIGAAIFYTASYKHYDSENESIRQPTPNEADPNTIEPTAYQRNTILHFALFVNAIIVTKIIGWLTIRRLLIIA